MTKPNFSKLLICGMLAGALGVSAATRADRDLPVKVTMEPMYPLSLATAGITQGSATFKIVVDNQGTLRDHLLVETTHPLFGKAVDEVIEEWDYAPSEIDGERINALHQIKIEFENNNTFVVGLDSTSAVVTERISRIGGPKHPHAYKIAGLTELDAAPKAVQSVSPALPYPEMVPAEGLRVVFKFYIDEEGRVRMPWIDEDEFAHIDESILDATYDALMQWEFTPPTIDGKAVVAQVAQPFYFANKKASLVESR
ncbi:MAG: hypothetical protein SynsKO_05440 [Synoicihabitans sp.]